MENKYARYIEFFNSKNGLRLEPVSTATRFDYSVLKLRIEMTLTDSIPNPHPEDLDNYDELTIAYSQCYYKGEQDNRSPRLYAVIKYNREKSQRNHL